MTVSRGINKPAGLTHKQEKALTHYLKHRNETEAYKSAYDCSRMKPDTIPNRAYELFKNPILRAVIDSVSYAAVAEAKEKTKIDAQWVLERAGRLADFNINRFIRINDFGEAVYNFKDATDEDWYCISEYTYDRIMKGAGDMEYPVEKVKLKTSCKLKALELVGKHVDVAAFEEHIELRGALATVEMDLEQYKEARREMLANDDC